MNLNTYEYWTKSEFTARRYLLGFCWKSHQRFCPKCRHRKNYHLANGRRRCARCGYTFHDFSHRWINHNCQLSCRNWLRLIKLFELEISTRKIAQQLDITYNTIYKAVTTLRVAILAHAYDACSLLSGKIEMDESYFGGRRKGNRGRGAAGKVPVFGILERNGLVSVEIVPNVKAETVLEITLKKVRRGSIVYTDKYGIYDSLIFCGYRHLQVDHGKRFATGKVYINGLEGFWSYAKERLIKHHGISPKRFPLYLKELEFRYNHRYEDIYPILAKYLCDFVPNLS
jgi:transposase